MTPFAASLPADSSPHGPAHERLGGANDGRTALLAEIDFKWLMAGEGQWVDMALFQQDCAYAARYLRRAQASPCAALRECARLLQARRMVTA